MGKLDGQVAIVTGGGSGIGKGIARAFASEGCSLMLAARNVARLEEAASEIRAESGVKVLVKGTDVTQEGDVIALFKTTIDAYGRLDILVNNSGAFDGGLIEDLTIETWNKVVGVNITGPFLCTREAFRIMKPAGGGRIINIGSISAQRSRVSMAPYTTTKNAIWGLTQSAALEGRDFGIAVSCLHPGNTLVERRAAGTISGDEKPNEPMIATENIARTALLMATLDPEANMLSAIVLPLTQTYIGRG